MIFFPFITMLTFGVCWIYLTIDIMFGEIIVMGMSCLEAAAFAALEISLGIYIFHSALRLIMKCKGSFLHGIITLALIIMLTLPACLFLLWCERYGILIVLCAGFSILVLFSIPILFLRKQRFTRNAGSRLFTPETFFLFAGILVWIIAYYSPYRVKVKSENYLPKFHAWTGYKKEFLEKRYSDLHREAGIKMIVGFSKPDCRNDSASYKLAGLYNSESLGVICCLSIGDFVASSNTGKLLDAWHKFREFYLIHAKDMRFAGLAIDAESRRKSLEQQCDLFARGSYLECLKLLLSQYDRQRQQNGVILRQQFVNEVKAAGLKPVLVAMPYTVDDQFDDDQDLQALNDLSDIPPWNWDYPAFMIYRYQPITGSEVYDNLTSHLVWSYARSIAKIFGKHSCVLLGIANAGPYKDPDEFIKDMHIVKACGIEEIGLYRLDGFIEGAGIEGLKKFIQEAGLSREVSFRLQPIVTLWRHINFFADKILELI